MAEHSRRNFLTTASLGAAAIGVAAASPGLRSSGSGAAGRLHEGPLMAYVQDARRGDIAVMVGELEIVRHDPELATRLAAIAADAR